MHGNHWLGALAVAAFAVIGCSVPVARNLDEHSANRIIVALEQSGVATAKESDSQNEGKWLVSVQRTEIPFALGLLLREGLPPNARPGVEESAARGSLIPSMQSEQARLLAGTSGDLERTLLSIDGVVSARVHLAVPVVDPLDDSSDRGAPSASVLIRHRGKELPVTSPSIQRLVAGSVANLTPDRVVVVATQVTPPMASNRRLVPFGPFAVARESVAGLRLLLGGFVGLNLLMLALLLLFWQRGRKNRVGHPPNAVSRTTETW